jgi:hypothetical protein
MKQAPEDYDPPRLQCLLITALGLALWVIILFGITYAIYRVVD